MKWRIEPETIEKERNFAGGLRWGAKTAVIWGNCGLRNASPARFEREWGRRKVESLKSRVSKSEVEMEMEVAVSKMVGNARDATTNHCVPLTVAAPSSIFLVKGRDNGFWATAYNGSGRVRNLAYITTRTRFSQKQMSRSFTMWISTYHLSF